MHISRRSALAAGLALQAQAGSVTRYVRFRSGARTGFGIWTGEEIRELSGNFLGGAKTTGKTLKARDVKLLAPVLPNKIFALARNYHSHLGTVKPPARPEFFFKPTTSLCGPDDKIVLPKDSTDVHFECELVAVIGKRLTRVSKQDAAAGVFGVTCGNDVSERQWQNGPDKDIQWWRAKGSDTFGPIGPCVVTGLNYGDLPIRTRLNGKVVQEDRTSKLIFDVATMISFCSNYVTLEPGDLVFTGTPGTTRKMAPGDVVEVEIEGIGVLRNPVTSS